MEQETSRTRNLAESTIYAATLLAAMFFPTRAPENAGLGKPDTGAATARNDNPDLSRSSLPPRPADAELRAEFQVIAESFADLQILRYQVPEFEKLSLQQKQLAYYLYEAALCGRDIIYDQKDKHGLMLRKTLENMYETYSGDRQSPEWQQFKDYCGRFWFSNGNHHHYSNDKFVPACSFEYFKEVAESSNPRGFPSRDGEELAAFLERIKPLVFDPSVNPKLVDLSPGIDNVKASSVNFYENVTQAEVEEFYRQFPGSGNVPSWGLNSKLVKEDGEVKEKTWKIDGMYGASIAKMAGWLEKARDVAENPEQAASLDKLIKYYRSGDLKDFDDYCIAWVNDKKSAIDVVNGFIEVYNDPIGKRGSFESVVSFRDPIATERIEAIANEAQWFEDHSPIREEHKKREVKGITAKAITVVVESGDAAPATPIGINLPNSDWIRKEHGSKSVSLSNITHAYNEASSRRGAYGEFAYSEEYKELNRKYGALASDLHTDMHECIGHASGQLNPGVDTPEKTLKNYASCLEEARADLVALYYIYDQKLVDIGVMPNLDVGKTEYNNYITNGLITQLTRIELGNNLEEAHMRNRQLIAKWAYEHGKEDNVIELVKRDDKTYVRVNDYEKLRKLFGDLLREIQRIKSEGDFESGKALVEGYGVKVDQELLKEVKDRYQKLDLKPYSGFIQPRLVEVKEEGRVVDVKVEYPESFFEQMIEYGKKYSTLPTEN